MKMFPLLSCLKRIELRPVVVSWTALSTIVSLTCTYTFLQPVWLLHPDHIHSFGILNHCYNHQDINWRVCDYFSLSNLPSDSWRAVCVLFGGGCVLMCLSCLCAFLCLCVNSPCVRRLVAIGSGLQTCAAPFLVLGVMIYPLGTDSPLLEYYCGCDGPYDIGHCHLGWAFMAALAGTACGVFCPVIAYFVSFGESQGDAEHSPRMIPVGESSVGSILS